MKSSIDFDAIRKRSERRRTRMSAHRASGHADAEHWDLLYWQAQGPDARLSALVAILDDVDKVTRKEQAHET